MKKRLISLLLVLTLALGSVIALASCDNNEQETESSNTETTENVTDNVTEAPTSATTDVPTEAPSETESEKLTETDTETETESVTDTVTETVTETETATETETVTETETETVDDLYGNGDTVKDAGVQWDEDIFALKENVIDESKAVEKSAEEIFELLKNKTALSEGEVYRVKETLVLESNTKYYGNLAAIIAEGGIVIKDVSEVVLKELIIKGDITIENSTGITFFKVDLQAGEIGVKIDEKCSDIALKNCKVSAQDTAVSSGADLLSVYRSYLSAANGLISTGDDLGIQDSTVVAIKTGISSTGKYCTVRGNTVEMASDGIGIDYKAGSYNGLIALNVVKDAQTSIKVTEGYNCVVLLNSAITVVGDKNTNLYVVENKLGGKIELSDNKYLLCDGNTFAKDGKDHTLVSLNNTEYNGDNLHDVNAREEFGAKEELLPHTNKDLFVGMERHGQVRDVSLTKKYTFNNYVRTMSRKNSFVIVPPGAYGVSEILNLDATHSNTTIYAYGVYEEKDSLLQVFQITNGNNITVKGLTLGYTHQSSGQVYVLEKFREDQKVRVITNAGYIDDFGASNTEVFSTGADMFFEDSLYPWKTGGSFSFVEKNEDGTMIFKYNGSAKEFATIGLGDVFDCRLAGDNSRSIYLNGQNLKMKDCVLYGYAAALAIVSGGRGIANISLERFHNTVHSGYLIDEETYNKYKGLEETYGVDLEVYIDELGRYRGGLPRVGSVDATHIHSGSVGVDATSCLFESMCDDGSNQRGSSSRLAGYHDNGDGTTTLYFKGTLSQTYYGINIGKGLTSATPTNTTSPKAGDKILVYASNGHIAFEGNVLDDAQAMGTPPVCTVDHGENADTHCGLHMFHYDSDRNCICDDEHCKALIHVDIGTNANAAAKDGKCDVCGTKVYTDLNTGDGYAGKGNNVCDVLGVQLSDANGDGLNDSDNVPIITTMTNNTKYNQGDSSLTYQVYYSNGYGKKIITYNCNIKCVTVKTEEVNFKAFEGYDLTDNDYFMEEKILFDNLSMNSAGFTFDNTMVRFTRSRGILVKTTDATIKNCTFRDFGMTGVLLSVETTWGESTVPQNITIQGCLFDNTGCLWGESGSLKLAPIAVQGLGDLSGTVKVSEDTLPCKNVNIIGNKFMNITNNYCITLSAAQGITIKDNVFVAREGDTAKNKYGRAIYINGCANINISGNTYSEVIKDDITKSIVAKNYVGLTGSDVEGAFAADNIPE